MVNKKLMIKTVAAKELYDILEKELKYRIRECSFHLEDRHLCQSLFFRDEIKELEEIVYIQDALDDGEVERVSVNKDFTEPTAENTDGGEYYIYEFEIDKGDYGRKIKVSMWSLDDDYPFDSYYLLVSYKEEI